MIEYSRTLHVSKIDLNRLNLHADGAHVSGVDTKLTA